MNRIDPAKQALAIDLLAHGGYTVEKVAFEIDVAASTVHRWRQMPEFNEAVIARARQLLRDRLPEVYTALVDEAAQGHHQHIKILLDHVEKLEEKAHATEERSITFTWRRTGGDPDVLPAPSMDLDGEALRSLSTGDMGAD